MSALNSRLFPKGKRREFAERYCDAKKTRFGYDDKGSSHAPVSSASVVLCEAISRAVGLLTSASAKLTLIAQLLFFCLYRS
jgi:hypothetical protein